MKNQTVRLGSLEPMQYFKLPGAETLYRTIDYRPSNTCETYGTRWCLNMSTIKAEWMFCRRKVFHVTHDIEFSEKIENK
jgi:hypothetical protein